MEHTKRLSGNCLVDGRAVTAASRGGLLLKTMEKLMSMTVAGSADASKEGRGGSNSKSRLHVDCWN